MTERGQSTKEGILEAAQTLVLEKGFSATSLDDIIKTAGVTKGAFFHHFRSKADLARILVERFADNDFAKFDEWDRRAEALADDPYQAMLIFLKLFEEWLDSLAQPFAGCMFAVYVYENRLFDPEVNDFVKQSFERWQNYYEQKFKAVLAVRRPRVDITARELAESILSILEGAFILARSYGQPELTIRQSRLFRTYLKLLFEDEPATATT
jgi:TetR/AcrR family transcriptional regulator, transcriptional repressor for nem operon